MKLLPLYAIPGAAARLGERNARAAYPSAAASYCIQDAPGCYSGQPREYGWVLTRAAADACAGEIVRMVGGTVFHPRSYREV